jgi:peptidyl-tRNA hydrolase, PTH1 family
LLTLVGLGNPGAAYRNTRHNAGFMLLDGIIEGKYGHDFIFRRSKVEILKNYFGMRPSFQKSSRTYTSIEGEIDRKKVLFVKPKTFMNESGRALTSLRTQGAIQDLSELLVVVDDVDLEIGKLRIRLKGSAGGHNGLKSIISSLGSDEFARLRIGVGPRPAGSDMVDYVLGSFRPEEWESFSKSLEIAAGVVETWVKEGFEKSQTELQRMQSRIT